MPRLSPSATSVITILNNINELIVDSSERTKAKDVMKALVVYAKNQGVTLPEEKIENFFSILIDSRPYTLTSLIQDIALDVLMRDAAKK